MAVSIGPAADGTRWPAPDEVDWLTPEQLVRTAFRASRVVMMNEASSGLRRCVRTRRIGVRVMPMAAASGARLLALEAMVQPGGHQADDGVLAQPDMEALVAEARRQGLRVAGYDVDPAGMPVKLRTRVKTPAYSNWHDGRQAANLAALFGEVADDARMLVWSRNLHHARVRMMAYRPMGWRFQERTRVQPFVIDQTVTVDFGGGRARLPVLEWAQPALEVRGGNAGFVWREGMPRLSSGCDAWLLSLDNALEGPPPKKKKPAAAWIPWRS
ncbi:MAG TPA: hypothetical protein VKF59_03815 [Candidatus Dormibacteraeota bacterium]|nr:hypothetical protein [Candidatus Dormibacteraeota bacterium]